MSDLAKLARKAKKEKVKEHEISIMPLSLSDGDLIESLGKKDITPEEAMKLNKELIKKSVPGSIDKEIDDMSIEFMLDLQEAIMRANNLDDKKVKAKVDALAKIKKEQDAKSA